LDFKLETIPFLEAVGFLISAGFFKDLVDYRRDCLLGVISSCVVCSRVLFVDWNDVSISLSVFFPRKVDGFLGFFSTTDYFKGLMGEIWLA
jgi:hypothetical protein